MNQNSLFEILAILIGFAGIMLVLSLLVTALTQAIAHFLSIRAKNLEAGLAELLASAQQQRIKPDFVRASSDLSAKLALKNKTEAILNSLKQNGITGKIFDKAAKDCANALAEYQEANKAFEERRASTTPGPQQTKSKANIKKTAEETAKDILESNSLMKQGKISYLPKFMAPKASWVLKEELEMLLHEQSKEHSELTTEVIEKAMSWFSRMERGLSQRFSVIMRCITFGCALLVAVVFQVSAPDVLKRLSTDPQYRAKAEMEAINLVSKHEADYTALTRYEDVSAKALEQLQENHPDLQETLEEVSGIGNAKNDILDELSVVLEDNPRRQELVVEYESILDKLHREGYEQAGKMIEESIGTLALFDIAAFSHGAGFYWNIQNLLGILMTIVLISLGAPFWFSTLRRLVALRDVLAPEQDKKDKGKATTEQ
ncbi:MAG TPA: hypothetical protein VMW72_11225 [Sedimentisphaerales bacterium]|nr:hypothetical protein [Sedimentisphaerales bacterium]